MLTAKVIDFGAYRASRDGSEIISSADNDDVVAGDDIGELSLILPDDVRDVHASQTAIRLRRPSVSISTALSALLHTALIAYVIWMPLRDGVGIGGLDLEAVSVDIVDAAAFESLLANATSQTGGAVAPIEAETGSKAEINWTELAAQSQETKQEPVKEQPEAMLKADAMSEVPSEVATADVVKPDPKPPEPERSPDTQSPTPEKGQDKSNVPAQAAVTAGGSVSQMTAEISASDGRSSASAGDLTKFAIEVRMAIGRARPKHDGSRGRVFVLFSVTETGELSFAESDAYRAAPSDLIPLL